MQTGIGMPDLTALRLDYTVQLPWVDRLIVGHRSLLLYAEWIEKLIRRAKAYTWAGRFARGEAGAFASRRRR